MSDTNQPLLGKIALVTGAGGGIGKATVLKLAEAGADIFMCDKKTETCRDWRRKGQKRAGRRYGRVRIWVQWKMLTSLSKRPRPISARWIY